MSIRHRLITVAAAAGLMVTLLGQAQAAERQIYSAPAFEAAQAAGQRILVFIAATWCPTCKAQKPILESLSAQPENADLVIFDVDFDSQKDVVREFKAQMQSTLIAFRGKTETGRSVGDTNRQSIASLLASSRAN